VENSKHVDHWLVIASQRAMRTQSDPITALSQLLNVCRFLLRFSGLSAYPCGIVSERIRAASRLTRIQAIQLRKAASSLSVKGASLQNPPVIHSSLIAPCK
jgi:hypothetical protein